MANCIMLSALLVFFLIIEVSRANDLCSQGSKDRRWSQYTATPAPVGATDGLGCFNETCVFRGIPNGKLSDGEIGPQSFEDEEFFSHTWDETVSIEFIFDDLGFTPIISGIVLYFYHVPSRGIGLPYNIRITSQSNEHPYQLEGNNNLTQEDEGLRSVTITPELLSLSTHPNDRFTIELVFHETDQIIWLFLTEVEICTNNHLDVILPDSPITFSVGDTHSNISQTNVSSSVTLTCSVTEGRYNWTWTGPTNPTSIHSQFVLNAGRTSVLELTGLSSDDEGTYQCKATRTFGRRASATSNVTLSLYGVIETERSFIEVDTSANCTAVLRCFLYGYLPSGEEPTIIWQDVNGNIISNDLANRITVKLGNMSIQNGGAHPVPSLISTLTVNLNIDPLMRPSRLYSCSSNQVNMPPQSINLTMLPKTTTPPPTTTPCTLSSCENTSIPIGVGIGGSIAVILIAMIAIIIIARHIRTKFVKRRDEQVTVEENEASGVAPREENGVHSAPMRENGSVFDMTENKLYDTKSAEELTEEDTEPNYEELDDWNP